MTTDQKVGGSSPSKRTKPEKPSQLLGFFTFATRPQTKGFGITPLSGGKLYSVNQLFSSAGSFRSGPSQTKAEFREPTGFTFVNRYSP